MVLALRAIVYSRGARQGMIFGSLSVAQTSLADQARPPPPPPPQLLQFVTGSSRVPLEGFAHLQGMHGTTRFSITNAGAEGKLPTGHTCFK